MTQDVPCIYKITNKINGKFYIGKTVNFRKRVNNHYKDFRRNKNSPRIQNAWNLYGEENFSFEIIEEICASSCELDTSLSEREQFYLDSTRSWDSRIGYNINKYSDKSPMYEKKHTEETKKKIREKRSKQIIIHSEETKKKIGDSQRGEKSHCWKKSPPNKGISCSEETKRKISEANKGKFVADKNPSSKLTWEQVEEIRRLRQEKNLSSRKIAKIFDVSKYAVLQILRNVSWKVDPPIGQENFLTDIERVLSEEAKNQISLSLKKHYEHNPHPKLGKPGMRYEEHPRAKVTFEIANEIREIYKEGSYSHRELARMFNLGKTTITQILIGKRWSKQ